jgi:hypothetical protein
MLPLVRQTYICSEYRTHLGLRCRGPVIRAVYILASLCADRFMHRVGGFKQLIVTGVSAPAASAHHLSLCDVEGAAAPVLIEACARSEGHSFFPFTNCVLFAGVPNTYRTSCLAAVKIWLQEILMKNAVWKILKLKYLAQELTNSMECIPSREASSHPASQYILRINHRKLTGGWKETA